MLVATPMHPSQTSLVELLRYVPGQPFTEILVLPADRWGWTGHRWRRRGTASLNARRLRAELARRPGRIDVYTSNIQTVEGFALAYATKTRTEPGSVSVVEDGLGTYEQRRREIIASAPDKARTRALARRAYLGPGAERQLGQMPFDLLDYLIVGWPTAIEPDDWPGVCIAQIPPPQLTWGILQSLASRAVSPDDAAATAGLDVLIALPLLRQTPDPGTYVSELTSLFRELGRAGVASRRQAPPPGGDGFHFSGGSSLRDHRHI